MKISLYILLLMIMDFSSFILTAKERKLRRISMINDDVFLSPGISCINIQSTITCYGVNANRTVINFVNKSAEWSLWNMIVLEDPPYDIKLDGISCIIRKSLPKCYLRLINLGYENLIEINPSKENWYKLCDHLAIKPITIINNEDLNIYSRTIKNEFYHKYIQNSKWNLNKISPLNNQFQLIGEPTCLTIDNNQQIICLSRIDNPTQFVLWNEKENLFQLIDNQEENSVKFSSDFSCISSIDQQEQTKVICFVVNQDKNISGIICQPNLNCSKWFLINSNRISFKKSKPISFIYKSSSNNSDHIGLYALDNNGLPYITTCQLCFNSIDNWDKQWSNWMELTSTELYSIETTFIDEKRNQIYILGLDQHFQLKYSIFDYLNHIPSPFYQLNNKSFQ